MKKYSLLIFTSIICVLSFLNSWCKDYLIAALWILWLPIDAILFIVYCTCFNFAMKKRKEHIHRLSLIILEITAIVILFFPFREVRTFIELELYKKQREKVIEKVKNNEYSYYYAKNIKLPEYKYVSTDGEIYVYQNNEEGVVICFWIYRGMLSGSVKLMYSDGKEELIRKNEGGHPIVSVKKLKENWYYVVTDY